MVAPSNGSDIIIKGGSVEVDFDGNVYPPVSGSSRKHGNSGKKITRIEITGDVTFDSGDHPGGLTCEIKTTCK